MDEIPVSLAIAQAAKETGWGTSRFAQEGNALFGQWTWSGEGIKPAGADGDSKHKVAKFKVLKASVKAYQRNLNTSRLSASTIEQLFEDTKYNLKKVKETKLVNIGNSIDHLPKEMKKIDSTKKRKNLFIQIVLPLIIEENTKIRLDRKKLFAILNKNNNSKTEKEWLSKKFKQYAGRGPVVSIVVTTGTLKKGDFFVSGLKWGKIRAIIDDKGQNINEAYPSTPVEVLGINGASKAGDDFIVFESEKEVKTLSETRAQ